MNSETKIISAMGFALMIFIIPIAGHASCGPWDEGDLPYVGFSCSTSSECTAKSCEYGFNHGATSCTVIYSWIYPNGHPAYIYGTNEGNAFVYCSVHPMCVDGQTAFNYTGPPGTRGVGVCRSSTWLCQNGSMDKITDEVLPGPRVCNGLDNDCDGHIDCECTDGQTRSCYDGPAGTVGVGLCRAGVQTCVNGEWDTPCQGEVLPQPEICDGLDNNCNGTIDEGFCKEGQTQPCYTGPEGTAGVGTCRSGSQACVNCQWNTECVGQILPDQEKCDGRDHNCNGKTNEGCDSCVDDTGKGTVWLQSIN